VLEAPPGAGKTTVVPLRLADETWLVEADDRRIVVLEPRRVATRAAAARMASLLGERVGETVGYRTRDDRKVGRGTRIEVVTEGILTRRLQHDPSLPGVGLVVFDEVHERNLQTDLALALSLEARAALRPDLRLLAMSATLEAGRIADLLGGPEGPAAPVVRSEGRSFPVEVRWSPLDDRERLAEGVARTVRQVVDEEHGDLLVFLPGAADIRRVQGLLSGLADRTGGPDGIGGQVKVRPLFGALSKAEQDAALAPASEERRRVVLATDIAETSLTVPGVRVVVDAGLVRTPRHDPRTGLTRLRTGPASQASAEQRAGRAGRLEAGVAVRLWAKGEHAARRAHAQPEIVAADLTGLALELAVWGTPASSLAWLDPPPPGRLEAAEELLAELGSLDASGRVTEVGRAMADLPVHPRLARLVVGGRDDPGLGPVACALAALLDERDVRPGPPGSHDADVRDRVRLVLDPAAARRGNVDRDRLRVVQRRASELARRADVDLEAARAPGSADLDAVGLLLALAYPDRLARRSGPGRYVLRHGRAAGLPQHDPLSEEPFLAVGEVVPGREGEAEDRIVTAAGLDLDEVLAVGGDAVEDVEVVAWDRDDLRSRRERRLGALVLSSSVGPAPAGSATEEALLERVAASGLGVLRWTDGARAMQARIGFLARERPDDDWPDVSDAALLASLPDWLGPRLGGALSRADLQRVDVTGALLDLVGHHRRAKIDRLAPTSVEVASGRSVSISYSGEAPSISVRAQDLYGTSVHPTVAGGRVPLVVEVLSPAQRPIQVTRDLPGFWAGSWSEVRKEMAGRYPKHYWPQDPSVRSDPPPPRR